MDDGRLWPLLRAVATDGDKGWAALLVEVEPVLARLARNQRIGRLRDQEDTPREIVTRVIARLRAAEFAAIRKLCDVDPPPALRAWLRVVVRRAAIDYMRESPEYQRGDAHREPGWISLATLRSGEAAPAPDSLAQKRDLVLAFVRTAVERAAAEQLAHGDDAIGRLALEWQIGRVHVRRLVERHAQYLAVLQAVLAGYSYAESAERLGTTRREVELTVRYIEELLHARRFGRDTLDEGGLR